MLTPISRTIGQKYRDREKVVRRSKGANQGFDRTPVKSTIWSHDGQKDRFVIFGRGAPKMGKKFWRETFGTIGVNIRSESEVPGWQSATKMQGWYSALCRVPPRHITPDG